MVGFLPLAVEGVVLPYFFLSAMHELLQLIPQGVEAEQPSACGRGQGTDE
jgi:hypothetical protein